MTKLEILDIPANIPTHYLNDSGQLYLDVGSDFSIRLTRQLEGLTDINKFVIDGIFGFSLPKTNKNRLILKSHINPLTPDKEYTPFECNIWVGTHVLRQNLMYLVKESKGYDVQIKDGSNHWIVASKDKKLNSITLDTIEMIPTFINDRNTNNRKYIDGTTGVYFPDVWYGALYKDFRINVTDTRPWLHLLYVLQKGFSEIGWNFKSELMESDFGRRLITYLIGKDFFKDDESLKDKQFKVGLTSDIIFNVDDDDEGTLNPTVFTKVIENNGGSYSPITGKYTGVVYSSFFFETRWDIEVKKGFLDGTRSFLTVQILRKEAGTNDVVVIDEETRVYADKFSKKYKGTVDITVGGNAGDIQLEPGDQLYCAISWSGDDFRELKLLKEGTYFRNIPASIPIQEGDLIDLANMIDKEFTLLDILKGTAHMFNFKFVTDFVNRTVTAYPPYAVTDFFGDDFEGFFLEDSLVTITQTVQKDSEISETPKSDLKRYNVLQFATAKDDAIKSLELDNETPIYSFKHDIGEGFVEKTQFHKNPFFEPTLNEFVEAFSDNGVRIELPHCVDNKLDKEDLTRKVSYNIGPRILYTHGITVQNAVDDVNNIQAFTEATINRFGASTSAIAFAYQQSRAIISFSPFPIPIYPTVELVYGGAIDEPISLYLKFYVKWWFQALSNLNLSLLILLRHSDFFNWSFRDAYHFEYYGKPVTGRLFEINDFDSEKTLVTPVVFLPEAQSLFVPGYEPEEGDCKNHPVIGATKVLDCWEFMLTGITTSAINSELWEWKYVDLTVWTTLVVGPPYTVCNADRPFQVRLTIDYQDACPTLTRTKFINECGGNSPEFEFTQGINSSNQPTLTVSIVGYSSPTTSITITYTVDGGPPSTYTGQLTNILGTIEFTAILDYSDFCADQTIIDSIKIIPLDEELPPGYWVTFEEEPHDFDFYDVPLIDNPPDWEGVELPDPAELGILGIRRRVKVFRNGQSISYVTGVPSGMGQFSIDHANNRIKFALFIINSRLQIEVWKTL